MDTDETSRTNGGAFWSDSALLPVAPATVNTVVPLVDYKLSDIKLCCDMITCSDSLNNAYKMKAMGEDGINIVFDDWTVQSSGAVAFSANSAHQMQVNLSSSCVKSLLFYCQGSVETNQNAWSNSHFPYLGIQQFQTMLNNQNVPPNPLSSATDIMLYNNRGRGVIGNELSQFVANSPFVAGRAECSLTAGAGIPTCLTAFMIYNNYEKIINENPNILKNGVDLKSGSSTITIKWTDNSDGASASAAACVAPAIGGATGNYTAYAQCAYQRLLTISNGQVDIVG